ncbi:MAG TPA: hypothetical protein PLU55_04875 [Candidatus Pacearchaeota archaeon]|jgi:membrane protease YdiL (CAAX protease family)|nr:hypothetical protein [Candidatus Pacearchaeota archaeon]HPJ87425.1 hypothetical protein [Candidatus Pacearchaeota archaeon]
MKSVERNFIIALVGLAIVEYLLSSFPTIGFFVYAVFVGLILILMENEVKHTKEEKLLIILMILPICRIAEIFLNLEFFWSTLVFYLFIIGVTLYYVIKFWLRFEKTPFIGNPTYFFGALGISGIAWAVSKYLFNWEFSGIVFLIPLIAYAEEIYFRGTFQNLANEWFGNFSILLTAFVYNIFSISYGFTYVLIAFSAALILSSLYHITKNIYISYVLNIIFHVLLFMFYPVVYGI